MGYLNIVFLKLSLIHQHDILDILEFAKKLTEEAQKNGKWRRVFIMKKDNFQLRLVVNKSGLISWFYVSLVVGDQINAEAQAEETTESNVKEEEKSKQDKSEKDGKNQ